MYSGFQNIALNGYIITASFLIEIYKIIIA